MPTAKKKKPAPAPATSTAVAAPDSAAVSGTVLPREESREDERRAHPIAKTLDDFLTGVDDYRDALAIAVPAVAKEQLKRHKQVLKKMRAFDAKEQSDGSVSITTSSPRATNEVFDVIREADRVTASRLTTSVARSLLIGLFSEYDSFIGNLLKAIYLSKQELFKGITRELSLTELLKYSNLDEVKRDMLEREVDSFRRESYVEQFAILERKFEIKTLRAFPEWAGFVELSQRRNVMTHNGGRVSDQYLLVCEREGYKFDPRPLVGVELRLDPKYMVNAVFLVRKIGFMLTHTLWNKVLPNEITQASASFNDSHFDLLKRKRWKTAAELGAFGLTEPIAKGIPDLDRRIRIINTAIALRKTGRKAEAIALLDKQDWSASLREFKLADAVLREKYHLAAEIMRDIGKKGELIDQVSYYHWPLFEEFSVSPEFLVSYESIYKVPFAAAASEELQPKVELLQEEVRKDAELTKLIEEQASQVRRDVQQSKPQALSEVSGKKGSARTRAKRRAKRPRHK